MIIIHAAGAESLAIRSGSCYTSLNGNVQAYPLQHVMLR